MNGSFFAAPVKAEIGRIRPYREQPRTEFDDELLQELAGSIAEHGLLVPLVCRRVLDDPDCDYEIVDGERRWRALQKLGKKTVAVVPVSVANTDDQYEKAVIANCARQDLSPMELARAVMRVHSMPKYAALDVAIERWRAVGKVFGKSFSWVRGQLQLLELAPETQQLVDQGKLGTSTAVKLMAEAGGRAEQVEAAVRMAKGKHKAADIPEVMHDVRRGKSSDGTTENQPALELLKVFASRVAHASEKMLDLDKVALRQEFAAAAPGVRRLLLDKLRDSWSSLRKMSDVLEQP